MQSTFHNRDGVKELEDKIRELQKDPRIRKMVEDRINDFKTVHQQDTYQWYEELVYCLLTAFASAVMGQKCVDALCCDNTLLEGSEEEIRTCLIDTGHRFPNKRAEYIHNTQYLAPSNQRNNTRLQQQQKKHGNGSWRTSKALDGKKQATTSET